MRTRRKLLVAGAALVALLALTVASPGVYWRLAGWVRGEAFYDGRPTSYWARQVEDYADVGRADYARTVLIYWRRPDERLPKPVRALRDRFFGRPPRPLQDAGPSAAPVLAELLGHPDPKVRYCAAVLLPDCGPAGRMAVPALRRLCDDPSPVAGVTVGRAAADALRAVDRGAE